MRAFSSGQGTAIPNRMLVLSTWYVLMTGCAVAVGLASATVQAAGVAPLGVSSVVAGAVLGASILATMHFCGVRRAPQLKLTTIGLAVLAVVAAHLGLYGNYRREWHRLNAEQPAVAMFRSEEAPMAFGHYLAEEASPWQIVHWLGDLALVTGSALALVLWGGGSARDNRVGPDS